MKIIKYITFIMLLSMGLVLEVQAKRVKVPKVYVCGFSASFNDSLVYFTDIQEVKDVWIDTKTKFLLGREHYSYQLKEYFTDSLQMNDRVCLVFYDLNKSKVKKKFEKMRKKYLPNPKKSKKNQEGNGFYEIRYLSSPDFKFQAVDMAPEQ